MSTIKLENYRGRYLTFSTHGVQLAEGSHFLVKQKDGSLVGYKVVSSERTNNRYKDIYHNTAELIPLNEIEQS